MASENLIGALKRYVDLNAGDLVPWGLTNLVGTVMVMSSRY